MGRDKSESGRGGWKTQGGGKTYRKFGEKPLPKNVFGPPTYDTFSPPLCWRLSVISLKRKRHRPDQPQFLRPPKVVLESTLCSTFPPPPPQIHAIRFAPPLSRCPNKRVSLPDISSVSKQVRSQGSLKSIVRGMSLLLVAAACCLQCCHFLGTATHNHGV